MMPYEPEYIDCDCHSSDHTLRYMIDDEGQLYTEVQLCRTKNFFQRVIAATKYVFGYNSRYGHWDCFMMDPRDKQRLIDIVKSSRDEV